MDKIDLLDHGFVRLVDHMGSDLSIVRAARVSYDADWRTGDDTGSDNRLINYLWKNRHTSPFEAVTFTVEVKAPIFVFRQWHRHRTWNFSEISARYSELPEEYYLPDPAMIGFQSVNNKQGRTVVEDAALLAQRANEVAMLDQACRRSFEAYHAMLASGWPRELARTVLPVSTYSHMFAGVSLLNLMKFWSLRSDPHAQYEIRVYSDAMRELVREIVPVSIEAYERSV